MVFSKLIEARALPIKFLAAGSNHNALLDFFSRTVATQTDPPGTVAENGLNIEMVWLKFHGHSGRCGVRIGAANSHW